MMQSASIDTASSRIRDVELARRIEADDADALRIVMRRHNPMLYRISRSILKDDAEAEDAVQDAYFRAYREIGAFRGDAKLSTWLARIVINESLARLRQRKRTPAIVTIEADAGRNGAVDAAAVEDDGDRPESEALRSEMRRLLERSIDALPSAFRTVFVLRALQELTVEETAAALDIPPATVRTRFFRARSLLRKALSREVDCAAADAFAFAGARCERIVARVLARLADRTSVHCLLISNFTF